MVELVMLKRMSFVHERSLQNRLSQVNIVKGTGEYLKDQANFFHQSLAGREPSSSLHWRNSGAYTCWSSECYVHPGWSSDVFGYRYGGRFKDHLFRFHTISNCAKYLLWQARISEANVFGHFLFVFFFFKPLLCWHVPYIFIGAVLIFPVHLSVSATRVCS